MLTSWSKFNFRHRHFLLILLMVLWMGSMAFVTLGSHPLSVMPAGGARESDAAQVEAALEQYFDLSLENSMAIVFEANHTPPEKLLQALRTSPHAELLQEIPGARPHRNRMYYLQLDKDLPAFEAEKQVPYIRQILADWSAQSGIKTWVTGKQAFFYDMGEASKSETSSAERWGLLLAFIVLIFNFGSLPAAALPLLVGSSTLLLTQVCLRLFGLGSTQTSMVLNSMVGLGLTIDYCLFMVNRYREERQQHPLSLIHI